MAVELGEEEVEEEKPSKEKENEEFDVLEYFGLNSFLKMLPPYDMEEEPEEEEMPIVGQAQPGQVTPIVGKEKPTEASPLEITIDFSKDPKRLRR